MSNFLYVDKNYRLDFDWKQLLISKLNVFYQWTNWEKQRWPSWPLIGWKPIWQLASTQPPLWSLWILGRSINKDGCIDLWLAETLSTSSLQLLNGFWRIMKGTKYATPSTNASLCFHAGPSTKMAVLAFDRLSHFDFCATIGKQRWPTCPLKGWGVFDLSSATTIRFDKI